MMSDTIDITQNEIETNVKTADVNARIQQEGK